MIIRSNLDPSADSGTRVEIYLGNVEAMSIKPRMKGLKLWRPSPAEAANTAEKFDIRTEVESLHLLATEGFSGYVISGRPAWREAERDLEAPTLFDFSQPWPPAPKSTGATWTDSHNRLTIPNLAPPDEHPAGPAMREGLHVSASSSGQ